jgi:hypothetical protein
MTPHVSPYWTLERMEAECDRRLLGSERQDGEHGDDVLWLLGWADWAIETELMREREEPMDVDFESVFERMKERAKRETRYCARCQTDMREEQEYCRACRVLLKLERQGRTHCPAGHRLVRENLYFCANGNWVCRRCGRERKRLYSERTRHAR